MGDQASSRALPGQRDHADRQRHLDTLADAIWDLEGQLAQVKAQRAALMNSLQAERHHSTR